MPEEEGTSFERQQTMYLQRSNGMKTIGVINIIVGAMFCLIGLLMAIVGGGFMPVSDANAAGTPGIFVLLIGIATLAINVLLLTGGIGLLRVASWGRTFSLAHAAPGVLVYAAWMIGGGFDAFFFAALVYAMVLIWLFYNTRWKTGFEFDDAGAEASRVAVPDEPPSGSRRAA